MKTRSFLTGLAALGLLCAGINSADAATVPYSFSHHGLLYNGDKLANGEYDITATLYNGEGNVIITKSQKVSVFDGFYNFTIDEIDPDEVMAAGGKMELGIKVGNNDEMTPRIAINSVPFALMSHHAEKADDLKCEGCVDLKALDPAIQQQIQGTAGIYPAKAYGNFAFNCTTTTSSSSKTTCNKKFSKGQNYTVTMEDDEQGIYNIRFSAPMPDADYVVIPTIVVDGDNERYTDSVSSQRIIIKDKTKEGYTINTQYGSSSGWKTGLVSQYGQGSGDGNSSSVTTVGAPISFVIY